LSLLLPTPESLDIRQVTVALTEMLEQLGVGQQREAHRIRFPGSRIRFGSFHWGDLHVNRGLDGIVAEMRLVP